MGSIEPRPGQVPFQAHLELLQFFLAHRDDIVERIQGVLNAQRKPIEYLQDGSLLLRHFEDCFFTLSGVTQSQSHLRGQLEEAHWASGFRPREIPGLHNGLIDPAEMMMRAFYLWRQTRWPGRNGRVRYAHTLFNVYVIQRLELLSLRLWDAPRLAPLARGDRLSQLQGVLDRLWTNTPADQPVLVRDARWLIQLAQSPATDDLGAYFEVAEKIAETLSEADRIEIHKAGVRMTAGHLRSQIRYHSLKKAVSLKAVSLKAVSLDDTSLVLSTRNTNALDFALLIQELVPLLEAYEHAWQSGDGPKRLELADAICQGISPDPELFLNRVALLGAYSMIEHLFVTTDRDGHVAYTPMGRRHVQLLQEYEARIGRVSKPLYDDCPHFRPIDGAYSPYGVLYGFSSNLMEHMALKTSTPDAATHFGLEDVFVGGGANKLAWVSGWRKLPHLTREVETQFDYPQQFAEDVYARIEDALRRRVADAEANAVVRTGRLFILPGDHRQADSEASLLPDLPVRYIGSSDRQLVAAHKAEYSDEPHLLSDRREGRCVVSYETPGGWVAITKAILTEVLGAGRDVKIVGPPPVAVGVLTLMCPNLVVADGVRSPIQ
ncbi:MAG TPA: hypothetical protein VI485_14010 [Vicinamibacterales bacterium]|nr:hypothetical protein [Vicinamibacterales bacterium]